MLFDLYQPGSWSNLPLIATWVCLKIVHPSHGLLSEYHHSGHPPFSDPSKHHNVDDYALHQIISHHVLTPIVSPCIYPSSIRISDTPMDLTDYMSP